MNLHIQKDLTYLQRQELSDQCKARMTVVVGDESSASAVGVSVAGSSGMNRSVSRGRGRRRGSGGAPYLDVSRVKY